MSKLIRVVYRDAIMLNIIIKKRKEKQHISGKLVGS